MNILTYTALFPNAVSQELGVFIYQRMVHVARRKGNTVRVVSPVPYFPPWLPIPRWQKYARIPQQDRIGELEASYPRYPLLPTIGMPIHGLGMYMGSAREVARLNRRQPVDCIDAHFIYPDGYAAVHLGRRFRIPVVVSARGTDINLYPSYPRIRQKICWTLQNAAGVIAVSRSLGKTIEGLGVPHDLVRIIPNGIDPARFFPTERADARRELGIREDGKVIVSVGNLYPQKCHERLIAAFSNIAGRDNSARLYIVGEGWLRPKLEEQIRTLQMSDRVILCGSRPNAELPLWFNAADFSCLPSSQEGCPNVVSESIACGTPVVATNAGGVPEILSNPELGVMVEQGIESLVGGLVQALNRNWNRELLVRHSRTRTWDHVAAEVEAHLALSMARWRETN
jgi:glycosyltransferase involved in cell wall biosynthesis